ncbi:hypothetical protein WR25_11423 isoform B [Diploscapter pachys]|uniref:Uncharacterized protein n=1 Tax=Diploscapter pachys TaxID=2018661 RepID=A0A2A2KPL0_9BILA|nr:hypothetical protein WR25_11423 isoform B [Diploscapter pachys]
MNTDLVPKETSDLIVDLISRNKVLELESGRLRTENRHLEECRRVTGIVMNQKRAELKAALSKRKPEKCEKRAVERHNWDRECGKILRLRSRDVPCERVDSDLSGSDSDASGSDQFDLEIDMVDQPSRGAQSSPSAIINGGLKKRKSDNTKRSPLPEKRKRRRRVVIDDDESEKEEPDDPDSISTINVINPPENHSAATPALTPNSCYPESLEDPIHERVAQEIEPIKADMEESSNWSLRASVSDSDNKSECSEIDVVGIDEKISADLPVTPVKLEPLVEEAHEEIPKQSLENPPTEMATPKTEQIEPMEQISPMIESQIVPKKSRKRLADELLVYAVVEAPTLMSDSFIKSLIAQQIPREDDNPIRKFFLIF